MTMKPMVNRDFLRDLVEGRLKDSPISLDRGRMRFDRICIKLDGGECVVSLCWRGQELIRYAHAFDWRAYKRGETITVDMGEPDFEASTRFSLS